MDTARRFSRAEWRRTHKALFASGCALLGVHYPDVAAVCDENVSTVKAWADPHRDHSIPDWAMRRIHRQLPALAAVIDAGMAALEGGGTGDVTLESAGAAEAIAVALAAIVTALPDGVSPEEGERALPSLLAAHARIGDAARAIVAAREPRADGLRRVQ